MTVDQGSDRRQAQPRKDSVMIASHFEGGAALKKPLSLYLTLRQHKLLERAAARRGVSKHLLVQAELSAFLADLEQQDGQASAPG